MSPGDPEDPGGGRQPVRWPQRIAAGAAIGQLLILILVGMAPGLQRLWRVRGEPALVRSAQLSFGAEFTRYIVFLREVIPEQALVVIPPREVDPVLGEMPLLQYYLFPRRLTNCPGGVPWSECVGNYSGAHTYILAVESFPPRDSWLLSKAYLPMDGNRGVFAPRSESPD
jgi:hypothetical protein